MLFAQVHLVIGLCKEDQPTLVDCKSDVQSIESLYQWDFVREMHTPIHLLCA